MKPCMRTDFFFSVKILWLAVEGVLPTDGRRSVQLEQCPLPSPRSHGSQIQGCFTCHLRLIWKLKIYKSYLFASFELLALEEDFQADTWTLIFCYNNSASRSCEAWGEPCQHQGFGFIICEMEGIKANALSGPFSSEIPWFEDVNSGPRISYFPSHPLLFCWLLGYYWDDWVKLWKDLILVTFSFHLMLLFTVIHPLTW